MKKIILLLSLPLLLFTFLSAEEIISVNLPAQEAIVLQPYTTYDCDKIDESSTIIKSRNWDNLYWTLNDSGGKNLLFPFNRQGQLYRAEWYKDNQEKQNLHQSKTLIAHTLILASTTWVVQWGRRWNNR